MDGRLVVVFVGPGAIDVEVDVDVDESDVEAVTFSATIGAARAVGVSVTPLRTLPTAAADTATATSVAAVQAAPMARTFLMTPVWSRFGCSGLTEG
jgi:hypothetical protein